MGGSAAVSPNVERCACGRRIQKAGRETCGQCVGYAKTTRPDDADPLIACPHCTSQPGWRRRRPSCCVCRGNRMVTLFIGAGCVGNIWRRRDCRCGACLGLPVKE